MSLSPGRSAALEQEIARLTEHDRADRAAVFAGSVRANVRAWQERLADPKQVQAARWVLLEAYLARVNATEDAREVFYAEKIPFARECLQKLLREDGEDFAAGDPIRLRVVTELLGGQRAKQIREDARAKVVA